MSENLNLGIICELLNYLISILIVVFICYFKDNSVVISFLVLIGKENMRLKI